MLTLMGGVLQALVLASIVGFGLTLIIRNEAAAAVVAGLNARIEAWWVMLILFTLALLTGKYGAIMLFALVSFLALREFITLTPTRRGDHRALFWTFFVFLPLQYVLVAMRWYGTIQWGLMVCVYCVSHAPALLMLKIPGYEGQNARLLVYLVVVVQVSEVVQYLLSRTLGRHPVAPTVSPKKMVEGVVGGVVVASLVGAWLSWATPFPAWQGFLISLIVTLVGFAGSLCTSAIKRDRRVKEFGQFMQGRGGMLDRIDALCFAAPIFFHLVRFFFAVT
jgi:phosphatidate cytidylyltransferase